MGAYKEIVKILSWFHDQNPFNPLGKKLIFRKLRTFSGLQKISKKFYSNDVNVSKIGNATIQCFGLLHSHSFTFQKIRKQKHDAMVASDCSKIDPALIPPSPGAAFYHGLRVYNQIAVWKDLSDFDKDLLDW